jgi:nucleotide-binding universal stress UspA family protein
MSPPLIMTKPTASKARRAAPKSAAPIAVTKTSIVCGTDFSEHAAQAVEAAAALAKRLGEPLVLVHAVDKEARTALPADLHDSLCLFERAQLHEELERLRAAKVEVTDDFRVGKPDAVLVEAALAQHARLLVVSSHGRKPPQRWVLGSIAERTAEASPVPTLVVRAAAPFTAWMAGKRRLRVFVGADFSAESDAALRWVAWLQQLGACDVVATYLEPTVPAGGPFDLMPSPIVVEMLAQTDRVQARSFRQRVRAALGTSGVRVQIEKGWGRSDAHLIEMARKERTDLIVVGTHQRHGLARVGHLSVSRGVLHHAPMSVACVPARAAEDASLFASNQTVTSLKATPL